MIDYPKTKTPKQQQKLLEHIDYTQLILLDLFKLGDAEQNVNEPEQFIARVNTLRRDLMAVVDDEYFAEEAVINEKHKALTEQIPQKDRLGHANPRADEQRLKQDYARNREIADALARLISRLGFIQLTTVGFDETEDIISADEQEQLQEQGGASE